MLEYVAPKYTMKLVGMLTLIVTLMIPCNSGASKEWVLKRRVLSRYDPDLLRALGLGSPRPQLNRGMSENELLAPGSAQPVSWQEDPDVTHGSLGNPRRRPSVAMGVRSIRPKHSGTAYRHSSSIYASDMELHRTDATVTSDASQGYDVRNFQSHGNSDQYHSQSGKLPSIGSSMANHSLGSSPTLIPPYDYEDTSPQPDNRRENTPSSTPSQRRMGRPLSNISSASESCCSGCCERHQEGEGGETSEHEHRPRPNPNSEGEADQSTDQRPQNSVAWVELIQGISLCFMTFWRPIPLLRSLLKVITVSMSNYSYFFLA